MSALVQTAAPGSEPFDLTEAKSHLRVDHSTDDTLIGLLITAARSMAEEYLQRRLITQTWVQYLDCFPEDRTELFLPYPPLQSVTSVEYKDPETGNYTTWANTNYVVDFFSQPGRIAWGPDTTQWPTVQQDSINAVKITFICGYGGAATVPEQINQAIKFILGHMYENREDLVIGTIVAKLPKGSEYFLQPFRMFQF